MWSSAMLGLALCFAIQSQEGLDMSEDAWIPYADMSSDGTVNDEALDRWLHSLAADGEDLDDYQAWLAGLWTDFGDPKTNGAAQMMVLIALGMHDLWNASPSPAVRSAIRNALLRYCRQGGLANVAEAPRIVATQLASALALAGDPDDPQVREALLDVAALITREPLDSAAFKADWHETIEQMGDSPQTLSNLIIQRHRQLLEQYRRFFGNDLPGDFYRALNDSLIGDYEKVFTELAVEAAEQQHTTLTSNAEQPASLRQQWDKLRSEVRKLLRERGDAARVERIFRLVRQIDHQATERRRRRALEYVLSGCRRLLAAPPGRIAEDVVQAVRQHTFAVHVEHPGSTWRAWGQVLIGLAGHLGSGPLRSDLERYHKQVPRALEASFKQLMQRIQRMPAKPRTR